MDIYGQENIIETVDKTIGVRELGHALHDDSVVTNVIPQQREKVYSTLTGVLVQIYGDYYLPEALVRLNSGDNLF